MKRVVYNACYGGFSISLECYLEMVKLGFPRNIVVEDEIQRTIDRHNSGKNVEVPVYDENSNFYRWCYCKKSDLQNIEGLRKKKGYPESYQILPMTHELVYSRPRLFRRICDIYLGDREIRHSKYLLQAISNLGLEACSGPCAKLEIKEINSNAYRIEKYDGRETVYEIDLEYEDLYIIGDDEQ